MRITGRKKSFLIFLFGAFGGLMCSSPPTQHETVVRFGWIVAKAFVADDLAGWVNPMIGTGGHGHTFPGATVPFGMVQLSPDTRLEGWDGCSGYHYSDTFLYGFSHTHLSGTGCSDYGDILLMPATAKPLLNNGADGKPGYRSAFRHADEVAEAGYYSVLPANGVRCELTASPRTGIHRYTFPAGADAHLLLDLVHRDAVSDAAVVIENDSTISGYRFSGGWGSDQRVWFSATFSAPFTAQLFRNDSLVASPQLNGKAIKASLRFGKLTKPLEVKLALSSVSCTNAAQNRRTETNGLTFDAVRAKARQHWNAQLSKITVTTSDIRLKRIFYTALYHCCIAPNVYSDVNGDYRGRDGQAHTDTLREHYTVFSLWDTYRALHPLFTITDQRRTADFIHTFITQQQQSKEGRLPMWELSANETNCMIGYHAVPVIADAYVKGIRGYDTLAALNASIASANADYREQRRYAREGFVAGDNSESVSQTLEFAYDDWCISEMAKRMGNTSAAATFGRRSQAWKNLFDEKTSFFRPRRNNAFVEPFSPNEVNTHYTEANAWHYSLYVPQDIPALVALHGGNAGLVDHLDKMFTASSQTSGREQPDIAGLIGQYAHGNEPSHHMSYLYAVAGAPWKTQERVNQICRTLYQDTPDGLCGNEDCGQLSAWFVLSAMGFYPVTPGCVNYVIGSPLFEAVTLHLENGKTFTITAPGAAENRFYITESLLNGIDDNREYLSHETILKGGKLEFTLDEVPDKIWGMGNSKKDDNVSFTTLALVSDYLPSSDESLTLVPRILNTSARGFTGALSVILYSTQPGAELFYATDSLPNKWFPYTKLFTLTKSTSIRAFAKRKGYANSDTVKMVFNRAPDWTNIVLTNRYAPQYAAGGDRGLIDGITGRPDFRNGDWQGYEGVPLEATVDLGAVRQLDSLRMNFLQDEGSWVFLPVRVAFYTSTDGKTYTRVGTVDAALPPQQKGVQVQAFAVKAPVQARYVRATATPLGNCPAWHPAAGKPAWLFADELIIRINQ